MIITVTTITKVRIPIRIPAPIVPTPVIPTETNSYIPAISPTVIRRIISVRIPTPSIIIVIIDVLFCSCVSSPVRFCSVPSLIFVFLSRLILLILLYNTSRIRLISIYFIHLIRFWHYNTFWYHIFIRVIIHPISFCVTSHLRAT